MVDRIERVSALKPVESGIGKFFERKEGYEDHPKNKKQFAEIFRNYKEKYRISDS